MSLFRYTALNVKRFFSDFANLFFTTALPVVLYLVFGALQDYGSFEMTNGDMKAYVLIGMALYGGATATASYAGVTVVESRTGWGRQLALTPLTSGQKTLAQAAELLIRGAIPVAAVLLAGFFTGAEMVPIAWVWTFLITVLMTLPFGLYGLIIGQIFRTEAAVSIATTALVLFAFIGNVFTPLNTWLLDISKFTPMFGAAFLSRYPLTEGEVLIMEDPWLLDGSLSVALVNVTAWTVLFISVVLLLDTRQKGRV